MASEERNSDYIEKLVAVNRLLRQSIHQRITNPKIISAMIAQEILKISQTVATQNSV